MIAVEFLQLMELLIVIEIVTGPQCTNPPIVAWLWF
jgi:hypothetical protein